MYFDLIIYLKNGTSLVAKSVIYNYSEELNEMLTKSISNPALHPTVTFQNNTVKHTIKTSEILGWKISELEEESV